MLTVAASKTRCDVIIDVIPPSSRPNFRISVQNNDYGIPQSGPVEVEIKGDAATARIVSNDLYNGSVRLDADACKNGPVLLKAKFHPARVAFKNLPPNTSVTCTKGCPKHYPNPQEPDRVEPIPMPGLQHKATFFFQADGFFEATKACLLTPGPNVCNVVLKPRPG